jgi:cytochrome oxidase Cu insertion factor (SCO1/SenC/PrrC family)
MSHARPRGRSRGRRRAVAASLFLLCALLPPQALAQHQHAHGPHTHAPRREEVPPPASAARPGVIEIGRARLDIPDVEVLDQDGRRVRFYTDLIKGRVVVMNFFFTSCTLVCPIQGRALARLRGRLGGRLGKEVFFISVSQDPATDTPERLKLWGADYAVGPGWTLVTGEEGVMTKLVRDFTGSNLGGQYHSPILLIGNDRTGRWEAAEGLSAPEELVKTIDRISGP